MTEAPRFHSNLCRSYFETCSDTADRRDLLHACKSHSAPTNLGCEFGPRRWWRRNRTFWTIISFSNAFSNADDYVRSRLNAGD
jgi:hypothetical protein